MKLVLQTAPYIRKNVSVKRMMLDVIIALMIEKAIVQVTYPYPRKWVLINLSPFYKNSAMKAEFLYS